jgi:hypothetical protein
MANQMSRAKMRQSLIRKIEQEPVMPEKSPPPPPVLSKHIVAEFRDKSSKKISTKENNKPELIAVSDGPITIGENVTSIVLSPAKKEEPKEETKEEPKKEEPKKSKMKAWPNNPAELLPYKDIANPLKDILNKGYRLFRKDEVKHFDYEGFNIGKQELQSQPSPRVRFSEKCLEYEKKLGHNLIDVVLNVMFLMGVEQGRRAERRDVKPIESLVETLEKYRETNKDLRIKIDELEVMQEVKEHYPNLKGSELQSRINAGVSARRVKRIEELKSELKLDTSKSSFQFKTPKRAKFRELESIARSLTKEKCTPGQWNQILEDRGWTFKEWKDKCKKKNVNTDFSS